MTSRTVSATFTLSGPAGDRTVARNNPAKWWRGKKVGDRIRSRRTGDVLTLSNISVDSARPAIAAPLTVACLGDWERTGATSLPK